MNRVIVSSLALKKFLERIPANGSEFVMLIASDGCIKIETTEIAIYCVPQASFEVMLYHTTIKRFLKHLLLFWDQPLTLSFDDSEGFGIKILEAYI